MTLVPKRFKASGRGYLGSEDGGGRRTLSALVQNCSVLESGGAKGNRTPDLLHAMQALSHLSYGPNCNLRCVLLSMQQTGRDQVQIAPGDQLLIVVGLGRDITQIVEGHGVFVVVVFQNIIAQIDIVFFLVV